MEIGLAGTEEMYSAVIDLKAEAGIEVIASHNPVQYNDMKIVKQNSHPLFENEFADIRLLAEHDSFKPKVNAGSIIDVKFKAREAYLEKIISLTNLQCLKPLKIVINLGYGVGGIAIVTLEELDKGS